MQLIKFLLDDGGENRKEANPQHIRKSDQTFLEIGKPYLFRTVTMIYSGRLLAVNEQEFLIGESAWIPDTGRWQEAVTKCAFNEVEPYSDKNVVIGRGGMLDVVEIPELIRKQK